MSLSSAVSKLLRSSAPTLLTALVLPPPFNIIASAVVSGLLARFLPEGATPAQPPTAGSPPTLSPEQVTRVVEEQSGRPDFVKTLRDAEAALKKYELDAGIRFAEIELQDRQRATDFQRETGLGHRVFAAGMWLVGIALLGMVLVVAGALGLVFGRVTLPAGSADVAVAAFGLIGTAVGFLNGVAANVVSFYWGSSQGSKEKSAEIAHTVRDLGEQLGRAANRPQAPQSLPQPAPAATVSATDAPLDQVAPLSSATSRPTPSGLLAQIMPKLEKSHSHFPDGVEWLLTPQGVAVEGAPARGTAGDPTTVTSIWKRYGTECLAAAKQFGVPVELIVATIATESGGDPNARRPEAKINDESVGLMQTLVKTAQGALGRKTLRGDDLLDPELSIKAGTAYIAQQRAATHFDPPLVAAAYNAGSLRRDGGAANRWKLLCFPTGTGRHIDTYVAWFADCMEVSTQQGWGKQDGVPSFAECFAKSPAVAPAV